MKSARQLIAECNELARAFYEMHGYAVSDEFKFYQAHHPQEVRMWDMAVTAYDHIQGTDIESCLDEINEELL